MAYTKYSLTPANNTAAPPDGAPEGMLPSAVNDTMRDMMAQIRDVGDGVRDGTYTMTAPKITGGTITGVTLTGNTLTNPVITGATLTTSAFNGTVGATTPSTGAFTTLSTSSTTTFSGLTASTALALDASKNVVSVTNTGTGNNVLATSPTLVTPVLGTPTSATLTNATGLPLTTGVTGTLPVANGGTGVTTSTGTGNNVLSASPTLTGTIAAASLSLSSLTSGRVTYATTSGLLTDSANLKFNGTDLQLSAGNLYWDVPGVRYIANVGDGSSNLNIQSRGNTIFSTGGATVGAGTEVMRITSAGYLGIGTSSPTKALDVYSTTQRNQIAMSGSNVIAIRWASTDPNPSERNWEISNNVDGQGYLSFRTGATQGSDPTTTRMVIESSGNVGIGTSSPSGKLTVANTYTNTSDATIVASATIPGINLRTASTGRFSIFSNYATSNSTSFLVGTGTSNPTTEAIFIEHTNGTTKFRSAISVGSATPTTSGAGITFPATQDASSDANTLDDYEEGTWTPALSLGGGSVTYTTQTGTYTKIGRLVTLQIFIKIAAVTTPSSYVLIQNPPFTMGGTQRGAGAIFVTAATSLAVTSWMAQARTTNNDIRLYTYSAGSVADPGSYLQATTEIQITLSYEV